MLERCRGVSHHLSLSPVKCGEFKLHQCIAYGNTSKTVAKSDTTCNNSATQNSERLRKEKELLGKGVHGEAAQNLSFAFKVLWRNVACNKIIDIYIWRGVSIVPRRNTISYSAFSILSDGRSSWRIQTFWTDRWYWNQLRLHFYLLIWCVRTPILYTIHTVITNHLCMIFIYFQNFNYKIMSMYEDICTQIYDSLSESVTYAEVYHLNIEPLKILKIYAYISNNFIPTLVNTNCWFRELLPYLYNNFIK